VTRQRRRLPAEVPAEEAAELRRRREAGETLPQLLEGFDGSYRTLRAVLASAGTTPGPQPLRAPPELIAAYEAGKSLREAAQEAGIEATTTAYKMLKRSGVTMRPVGRPPGAGAG
jgi:hypothetical protein